MCGKDDLLRTMQTIKTWPYYLILYAQARIPPKNETYKILWDFEIRTDYIIPARQPDLFTRKKDLSVKRILPSRENKRKRKGLARERDPSPHQKKQKKTNSGIWRKRWYQLLRLEWFLKAQKKKKTGRIETIQTTALLRSTTILKRILGSCLVCFYGISNIVGYLTPNPVFTHISNTWFVNTFHWYTQINDQTVLFLTIPFSIR